MKVTHLTSRNLLKLIFYYSPNWSVAEVNNVNQSRV
jgi:hypothetical protein